MTKNFVAENKASGLSSGMKYNVDYRPCAMISGHIVACWLNLSPMITSILLLGIYHKPRYTGHRQQFSPSQVVRGRIGPTWHLAVPYRHEQEQRSNTELSKPVISVYRSQKCYKPIDYTAKMMQGLQVFKYDRDNMIFNTMI